MHEAIVGRERELAAIDETLAVAHEGSGRLVLVAGEAGIGKTRLADAAAEHARAAGFQVAWGRCWEAGGAPPYWPWVQVLRAIIRRGDAAVREATETHHARLGLILPELDRAPTEATDDLDPELARFLVFEAVATVLRAATTRPTLIILDDLHSADEPSLVLLRYVVTTTSDVPIAIVGLYRDPELEAHDPRYILLAEIERDPFTTRVRPGALDERQLARLIETSTGTQPSPALVRRIALNADGNPLFATEVARLLAEDGRLGATDLPTDRVTVPETVKAVIGRRLARLSDECRGILQLASIVGREFDLELLGELGAPTDAALVAIDEAVSARVVQESRASVGRWRFAHALMRDVLYESMSLPARTGLHDRVGRALERLAGAHPDEYLSEIAYHVVLSAPGGDIERAVRYSGMAGRQATAAAAHEEAVRHHRNALACLDLDRSSAESERCRVLIDLGEGQSRAGVPEAPATIREAAAIAARLDLPDELARAAVAYGGRFMWARAGSDPHLIPLLEQALQRRPGRDDALRVRLLSRLAGALRDEWDLGHRSAVAAEAIAIARDLGDPVALVHALTARFWAISGPDSRDEMCDLADEVDAMVEATGDPERVSDARLMRVGLLTMLGSPVEEIEHVMAAFARSVERLREPAHVWYLGVAHIVFALARGDYAGLDERIVTTRETARRVQDWDADVSERLALYAVARERGDLQATLPVIVAAMADAPGYHLFPPVRAWIEAELGRLEEARLSLDQILHVGLDRVPRDNGWLWAMVHTGEAAAALGDTATMERVLELLRPYTRLGAAAACEVVCGPVGRTVGDLATGLGRFAEAEAGYRDALELVRRAGWRPWEAWTRWSRATMLLRRREVGDDIDAVTELEVADAIAAELGMPALASRIALTRGSDEATAEPQPGITGSVVPIDRSAFVLEGEVWRIEFDGRTVRLADSKGLRYLARLLAVPGREIPSIELVAALPGRVDLGRADPGRALGLGSELRGRDDAPGDPLLDPAARAAYRARLQELQEEIDEAERDGSLDAAARHREEFEAIVDQLTEATGLGGRTRSATSAAERARQSVTKAIRGSLSRIADADPALGAHLTHAVRTGMYCSYAPDPRADSRWNVDPAM